MNANFYLCWCPDQGAEEPDARKVVAHSAEQAAEAYAQDRDSRTADYSFANGDTSTVYVKAPHGIVQRFSISAEPHINYFATELT